MTTTESTLPPLVAAKLRRLLGVEPTDPVPDRITPRQVVTLHHGQRVTIANKSAWNDCADIHDALMASGIVETETKTVVIDTDLFRPIPLTTIGSTEWRAEFPRPDPATETATHTVVTRAALAEWWPCLGIEPGALLAAWMGIAPEQEDSTAKPTPTIKPAGPCVTKSELIDGLDLVGGTWESRLKIPSKGIDHYKPARLDKGRKGQGAGNQSTWDPVVFTRIAVKQKHLNKGPALIKFKKAWPQWQDELEAEMGEL